MASSQIFGLFRSARLFVPLAICAASCLATSAPPARKAPGGQLHFEARGAVRLSGVDELRGLVPARWSRIPSTDLRSEVYRRIPSGIYGSLRCEVRGDRFLEDCVFRDMMPRPADDALPIVMRLADALQLAPEAGPVGNIRYVDIDLYLRAEGEEFPCIIPFCVIHHAAPPPPPPPPQAERSEEVTDRAPD